MIKCENKYACMPAVASFLLVSLTPASSCFQPVPHSPARINFLVAWRTQLEPKLCLGMSFRLMDSYDKTFICSWAREVFWEKLILREQEN